MMRRSFRRRYSTLLAAVLCGLIGQMASTSEAFAQADLPRGPWVPSWEVLYGGFRQLEDVAVTGRNEGWALDRGAFLEGGDTRDQTVFVRWQDGVWRASQIANDVSMAALDVERNTGFAVGDGGAIYRLIGGRWLRFPSPTANDLVTVELVGPAEGWASGERGTILRWDGGLWLPTPVPNALRLVDIPAVASAGPGQAYAMAESGDVLIYADGSWRIDESAPKIRRPAAIAFDDTGRALFMGRGAWELNAGRWSEAGPDDLSYRGAAWVSGEAYVVVGDAVYRYADRAWLSAELPGGLEYSQVVGYEAGFLALASQGAVVRKDEGEPAAYLRPSTNPLEAIDAVSADFGWAGGVSVTAGMVGARDGRWRLEQAQPAGVRVIDLDLASATDGWAVGSAPGPGGSDPPLAKVWRWDGERWNEFPVEKTWIFYEVNVVSETEVWASGPNVVARWDGDDWLQVAEAPFSASFAALSMLAGGESPEGWFGAEGAIYHMTGTTWTAEPIPENYWVPRMVMSSANAGWAIARQRDGLEPDLLLRYDGSVWQAVALPIPDDIGLLDVDSPVPGTAWVLVDANGLLHWNGESWEYHVLSPLGDAIEPRRVRALKLNPDKRDITIWLAGGRPTVARYGVVEPRQSIFVPIVGQSWRR